MKKSNIATLLVFFLLIPATLFLGAKLPGRSYYITGTLIVLELMLPFFMAFEGRRPQARELVLIAVMSAVAIAGRVVIPVPHIKAIFAVIMVAGIAFGPETGFMVGAISAFASNFFYGQGAYTPWQMFAYGAGGMLAGFAFSKGRLPRQPLAMAFFGFFSVILLVCPLLDCSGIFLTLTNINFNSVMLILTSGFVINLFQAVSTALVLALLGKPLLERLERVQVKYGMLGEKGSR